MKAQLIKTFILLIMITGCTNSRSDSPADWSEEELGQWYSEEVWKHGFQATPDESVNQREMAIRYYANPDLWETAFKFLEEQDLANLNNGRHDLQGNELFVMVSEYIPREADSVKFEAHREYADIQYVASGQEQISIVPATETVITTPYDRENDVMFMEAIEATDRIATPETFFVFFPSDAHRPSVRAVPGDSSMVKKIVVKVKLDELPLSDNQPGKP